MDMQDGDGRDRRSIFRRRRFWLIAVPASLVGLALSLFCVLRCGNPQWHRRIYMFRAYTWPRWGNCVNYMFRGKVSPVYSFHPMYGPGLSPPEDFTGVWIDWDMYGNKRSETSYRSGVPSGKHVEFYRDGSKRLEGGGGGKTRNCTAWYRSGQKEFETSWSNGHPVEKETHWDRDGNVIAEGTYRMGRPWDGTFWDYPLRSSRRWKEGRPWDGVFDTRRHLHTLPLQLPESAVEAFSGTIDVSDNWRTYRGGKPWTGVFEDFEEEAESKVVSVYKDGVVMATYPYTSEDWWTASGSD